MKNRSLISATLLAASLAFGSVAGADDDKENASGVDRHTYNSYLQCLRTPKIRFHGTIVDAALAVPELSTLAFAVQTAGLVDVLNSPGPFTVFAPTNDAFGAIPEPVLGAILADNDLLTAVLTYHVSLGTGRWKDPRRALFAPRERNTVQGQTVFFNRNSAGPQVNQSGVACQGVKTDNGVVWFIDSVLLPQF